MGVAEFITVASVWAGQERKTREVGIKRLYFSFIIHCLSITIQMILFLFFFTAQISMVQSLAGRDGAWEGSLLQFIHP